MDTKLARVVVIDGKWQRLVWKHWLRMAAIPEGSWSRCDWRARCGRRWGSCKSYQESTERSLKFMSFMFVFFNMRHDWESGYCYVMHGKPECTIVGLWFFQRKLHGILWRWILVLRCVVVELQLTGTRFWRCCRSWSTCSEARCCRWSVSWPFLGVEGGQCQGVGFRLRDTYRH